MAELALFSVPYFSLRWSRSSALRYGKPSQSDECQNYLGGAGRFERKRQRWRDYFSRFLPNRPPPPSVVLTLIPDGCLQGENERWWKTKVKTNTNISSINVRVTRKFLEVSKEVSRNTNISSIKRVTRKNFWRFHVLVVQNSGKEMYKKVVFSLIRPIVVVSYRSLCICLFHVFSIARFYIFFE